MWILISWLHQKLADLDQHCFHIYRLLHGVFDPSPDLSPSRLYQPESKGGG